MKKVIAPPIIAQKDVASPGTPFGLSLGKPTPETAAVSLAAMDDTDFLRENIFSKVLAAAQERFPVENERYRIDLDGLEYEEKDRFSKKEQKEALMKRKTLFRRLSGTWRLFDKEKQAYVEEAKRVVAHVPFLTERGTFIRDGNEYTVTSQARLKPGVYASKRETGEIQAQFNILDGGRSFKLNLDPARGRFGVLVGGANLSFIPVLKAMGASPDQIQEALGKELYVKNSVDDQSDKKAMIQFRADRFNGNLRETFGAMRLDPETTKITLNESFSSVLPETFLLAARKMLDISKGQADEDNRDALHFQSIYFPDDLFAERIRRDKLQLIRSRLLWRTTQKNKLDVESGTLTPNLDSVFLQSGLAQAVEESNPIELLDQQARIIRLGEGGIDPERVTLESRAVQPSYFGIIDPLRSPECFDEETEVFTSFGWKKWGEVNAETKFLCLLNGRIEYHLAEKLIAERRDGLMYGVQTKEIDFFVTPTHWLYSKDCDKKSVKKKKFEFIQAQEAFGKAKKFMCAEISIRESRPLMKNFNVEIEAKHWYFLHYSGMIYCAKVPGKLLLVRRKGCIGHWSGNSGNVGMDSRFTINSLRGTDGNVYMTLLNKGGERVPVDVKMAVNSIIAFPGELKKEGRRIRAMVRGKMDYIDRRFVDYELPHPSRMFSYGTNLVPLISTISGGRTLMGGKMVSQALPLKDPEEPLVQSLSEDGKNTFEELMGKRAMAVYAPADGMVESIGADRITLRTPEGIKEIELYADFPMNRKTYIHNTPVVQKGDIVRSGDLLAKSNFTSKKGVLALGKNLRTAYMVWEGNYEDGATISESAAQKLKSEHLHTRKVDKYDDAIQWGKKEFLSLYPAKFTKDQWDKLDDDGVIKPSALLQSGDPIILAVRQRPLTELHRGRKPGWTDVSEVWDREAVGFVTDAEKTSSGARITVKTHEPAQVADKISGRFGDKNIISNIVPDDQMPKDRDGRPIEIILNPLGVVTRQNPGQLVELALAKIAQKKGKVVKAPGFMDESVIDYAISQLNVNGISDTEELEDPSSGRIFKNILVGPRFFYKLHHMAEDKISGRDIGGYTAEELPAKAGGGDAAKRLGLADINALLSHNALNVLKDAKSIRGQRNDEYWKAFQLGRTPPSPEVPLVYRKFMSYLMGSGINLRKSGAGQIQLFAMTDKDIIRLSHGEVKSPRGVDMATMKEIPDGLFDKGVTGGHHGEYFSHIKLEEPVPNPVMEDVIKQLLSLTQSEFEDILSGKKNINGLTGGVAIKQALRRISVPDMKRQTQAEISASSQTKRDKAIKRLGYLDMFERTGLRPEDMILSFAPVIPPIFRPISATSKFIVKSDANALYVDLMKANEALASVKKELGNEEAGDEKLRLYKSFRAVTGLGDPISPKLVNQKVKGLLAQVFGESPKFGLFQRRVLGGTGEVSGRAVITPNSTLDMDQIGLPEEKAWVLFRPLVIRRLIRRGMKPKDAFRNIMERSDIARSALLEEMDERPVLYNRAPTLHKYNIMAGMPILTKGNTLQVSPLITKGFNADFDGDTMSFSVPVSDEAVREAKEKMLPSRNLLAVRDFKVHYLPEQEYQHGLYLASAKKKNIQPIAFSSKEEAFAAYKRGEIDIDTPVIIR